MFTSNESLDGLHVEVAMESTGEAQIHSFVVNLLLFAPTPIRLLQLLERQVAHSQPFVVKCPCFWTGVEEALQILLHKEARLEEVDDCVWKSKINCE